MNAKGHTTAEYAICLGLLALLAIGSLKLLGGNILAVLQAPISSPAQAKTSQLYALIGANIGSGGQAVNNKFGAGGQATPTTLQVSIDPITGSVLTTTNTTGGSKNTTSVPGDQAMSLLAQQLKQLAEGTMPDGQPVPDNLKALILKLMQDGIALSNDYNITSGLMPAFNAINAANAGKTSGIQPYPSPMTLALGSSLGNSVQFQQDYLKLNALMVEMAKSDPAINDTLLTPIGQLAGTITSIEYNNVGKPLTENYNANAVPINDLLDAYNKNPALAQVLPAELVLSTLSLPGSQSVPAIQNLITNATQNAQVGFPPTPSGPVNINLNMPTGGATGSGSMSGALPGTILGSPTKTSTSIDVSNTGINASVDPTTP